MPCLRKRIILLGVSLLFGLGLLQASLIGGPLGDLKSPDGWQVNLGEEFAGAKGEFTVRKDGEADTGVLAYDFTAGGQYIAVTLSEQDIGEGSTDIRLKVKSAAAQKLSLRVRDVTGQYHQIAIPYTAAGEWQVLRAPLAPLRAAFHFGGANDGVLHFPIQEVWLLVDKSDAAKAGEIVFTDLQATSSVIPAKARVAKASAPVANAALIAHPVGDLASADGWQVNLGEEFAGAKGEFTVRKEDAANAGVVIYDFTAGGQYIAVTTSGLEIAADHTEIQIKVKAATPQKLALRLGDATGQFHQVAIPYTKAGTWQTLRTSLPPLRAAFRFGGANDGVVHFPITEVWLIVDKPNGAKAGEIVFTEFQTLAPAAAAAAPTTAVTAPAGATTTPLAAGPLNFRMGVATHFGNGAHYIPNWKIEPCIRAAAELGVGWIRDDFHWKDYEKTKGRYVLPDRSRRWIEAANQAGLKIILIISGGNPIYENPYDPAAFARASAAIATELRGKIHAFEILNEPHNSGFAKHYGGTWNGYDAGAKTVQPWVGHYVTLLNAAAKAIRAVDASVKIIGLGSVPPVNFRQLALGIAPEVDGITEHPYSIRGVPELIPYAGKESILQRDGIATADEQGSYPSLVRMYREQSAKHKGPRELWMTEWGFASYQEAKPSFFTGVTREAQAKYALRRFVEDLGLGVEVSIWYALKDDGGNAHNAEDNFGLLTRDNTPKPAYAAVQRLARLMQPYAPMQSAPEVAVFTQNTRSDAYPITWDGARLTAPGSVKNYAFSQAGGTKPLLVLWTAERANGELQPRVADVEIKADWPVKQVRVVDLLTGDTRTITAERRGDRVWIPQLSVPDYPVALAFE